MSNSAKKC